MQLLDLWYWNQLCWLSWKCQQNFRVPLPVISTSECSLPILSIRKLQWLPQLFDLKVHVCQLYCRRKGVIVGNDQEGDDSVMTAHVSITWFFCVSFTSISHTVLADTEAGVISLAFQVPLNNMFGYSTALRSMTQVYRMYKV